MTVLASVIVPCYNAAPFVEETLASIFAQTWPRVETVVVDDGSTDGTLEILQRLLAAGRPFTLIREGHGGASAARNRGTAATTGEFVQYLDADDLITPDSIASKIAVAQSTGADVVYSDWQRLARGADGGYRPAEVVARRIEDVHESPEIAILTDFWAPPAALLYRRALVDRIGGWKEAYPVIQDARFFLDAALAGASFARMPAVAALYRVHRADSLSTRDRRQFLADIYRQAADVRAHWASHGGIGAERKRALLKVFGYVARQTFESDRDIYAKVRSSLRELAPRYIPESPKKLRLASRLLGYDNAERFASLYRKARRAMTGGKK